MIVLSAHLTCTTALKWSHWECLCNFSQQHSTQQRVLLCTWTVASFNSLQVPSFQLLEVLTRREILSGDWASRITFSLPLLSVLLLMGPGCWHCLQRDIQSSPALWHLLECNRVGCVPFLPGRSKSVGFLLLAYYLFQLHPSASKN